MTKLEKEFLRQKIKSTLSLLGLDGFRLAGERLAVLVQEIPEWNRFKTILVFMPLKNEIDSAPLLNAALENGKNVFVPRVESQKIIFFRIKKDNAFKKGVFGIREPVSTDVLDKKDFPALIFVPGLAFDKKGNRLGRGGGFYDRFIAEQETLGVEFKTIGVCLKEQIIDNIPVDKFDKPVDMVISC